MIVAAAICPCPPLLARELTGQAEVLPELRAACAAAVGSLAAVGPDVIVVAGPAEETASWDPGGRLDIAAYAPAPGSSGPRAGGTGAGLPLSLGIGARLLDEAGYSGARALHGIAALAAPDDCLRLGHQVARSAARVALLAMGDGAPAASRAAPGYLDERAAPFDAAVERAVRDADLAALAALDPDLAADLMAVGRARLAGPRGRPRRGRRGDDPAAADGPPPGPLRTEVLYSDAPFGVAYLVATLAPRWPPRRAPRRPRTWITARRISDPMKQDILVLGSGVVLPARRLAQHDGELDPGGDLQLAEDVVDVRVDGPLGDEQPRADFPVGQPAGHQLGDLPFAPGQQGRHGRRRSPPRHRPPRRRSPPRRAVPAPRQAPP